MPTKYRAIPVEVEAMQYTGTNIKALEDWSNNNVQFIEPEDRGDDPDCDLQLLSSAHSNWIPVYQTDWIVIKDGKYMRVNDETFKANYEEVQ